MAGQGKAVGLKLKNRPAGVLQDCYTGVKGGALLIQLQRAIAQMANLSNQPRVILENMHDGLEVGRTSTGRIEACLFDQVRRNLKRNGSAAHNQRYIKSRRDR